MAATAPDSFLFTEWHGRTLVVLSLFGTQVRLVRSRAP
jgi:hypothetical protein